jgi:Swiss Army Knife protein, DSP-PTPase phosphatase domain
MNTPIPDSYWVVPGRLLAGEYPGAASDLDARQRLELFLAAGITSYIDLTEADEGLSLYQLLLRPTTRYTRLAIRDLSCPPDEEMLSILDHVDSELQESGGVHLHCWGGHGRTGTVIGCWLSRQGLTGAAALAQLKELRANVPEADWRRSPETDEQRAMVLHWPGIDASLRLERALQETAAILEANELSTVREVHDLQPAIHAAPTATQLNENSKYLAAAQLRCSRMERLLVQAWAGPQNASLVVSQRLRHLPSPYRALARRLRRAHAAS